MTGLTRRQFAHLSLTTASLGLSAGLAGCSTQTLSDLQRATAPLPRVRFDWSLNAPVGLGMRDLHLIEADQIFAGHEIDWVQTTHESQAVDAAASQSLFVATASGSALMRGRGLGLPVVAISVAAEPNGTAVFSHRDTQLTTPQQLKGKRVAVQGGGESFYYLCRLLQQHKLTLSDITPVFLDPLAGMGSTFARTVDAWCASAPFTQNAAFLDHHVVSREPLWGTHSYLVTHENNVRQQPDKLQRVVDQYQTARQWLFFNQAQLSQRMVSLTDLPAEPILRSIADSNSFVDRVPTGSHQLRLIEAANVLETAGEIDTAGRNAAIKGSLNTTFAKRAPAIDFVKLQAELVG